MLYSTIIVGTINFTIIISSGPYSVGGEEGALAALTVYSVIITIIKKYTIVLRNSWRIFNVNNLYKFIDKSMTGRFASDCV